MDDSVILTMVISYCARRVGVASWE